MLGMLAVSVAAQLLMPKPKRQTSNSRAPEAPSTVPGSPLACLWGKGKLGGTFLYTTPVRKITKSGGGGKGAPKKPDTEAYVVDTMVYVFACVNPLSLKTLFFNGEVVFDEDSTDSKVIDKTNKMRGQMTFYSGSLTQNPDPDLVALEGAGNVPAFRGICYIVFRDIDLSEYGTAYPTLTGVFKTVINYPNLKVFLDDVLAKTKLEEFSNIYNGNGGSLITIDSSVSQLPFIGTAMMLDGKSYLDKIRPIIEAWGLVLEDTLTGDSRTVLKLPSNTTISSTILASTFKVDRSWGGGDGNLYQLKDSGLDESPNYLSFGYQDPTKYFESDSVIVRSVTGLEINSSDLSLDFGFTRKQAMTCATRFLRNFWSKKKTLTFTIPVSYLTSKQIYQGCFFQATGDPYLENQLWLVSSLVIGDNGFMDVTASYYNPVVFAYTSGISNLVVETSATNTRFDPTYRLIDTVNLDHTLSRDVMPFSTDLKGWVGTWNMSARVSTVPAFLTKFGSNESNINGLVTFYTGTGDSGSHHFYPDYDNKMTVKLDYLAATILNSTELDFLTGETLYSANKEVFSARSATLLSAGTYELTGLLRGTYDSEDLTAPLTTVTPFSVVRHPNQNGVVLESILGTAAERAANQLIYGVTKDNDAVTTSTSLNIDQNHKKSLKPILYPPIKTATGFRFEWDWRSLDRELFTITDGVARTSNPGGNSARIRIFNATTNVQITSVVVTTNSYTWTSPLTSVYFTVSQANGLGGTGNGFEANSLNQGN